MATILQQPDGLSLSGNLKKFVLSAGAEVNFTLKDGATVLVAATYEPGSDGIVTIDVRDIVESRLSYQLKSENFYEQTSIVKTFTASIDGSDISFRVIRAGVANLADTPSNWLRSNFLTWQPQKKAVTYYSPEWLTLYAVEACTIKLKAHFPDNTEQNVTLGSCSVGKAFTVNVQYAVVAGLLGHLYPDYYDVWAEKSDGSRLTYIQRYYFSDPFSEQEQWFLFENSLGGMDTIRAFGDTDFDGEHVHQIAVSDEQNIEYRVDTERKYTKNTGYLSEYERRWLLDFFPSKKKYVYFDSAIRSIVVVESDVKYTASELPSSYNFTYRFTEVTSLLNLVRNSDDLPPVVTIPDIDSPDFILPPRLSEYPRVQLHEGVIIPASDPNSDRMLTTTVGAIIAKAIEETLSKIPGGDGSIGSGGQLVNLLRSSDLQSASDNNVFTALRTLLEIQKAITAINFDDKYLSKVNDDVAQGLIQFLKGIEIGEFIPGMFGGKGGKIDGLGNAELTSLRLRALLEVPELRYNRLTVIGDELILTENGLIESVEQLAERSYRLNMKLEDGEAIAFVANDLIKGIFHNSGGFATSYMRIEEVGQTYIKVTLANDADVPPLYNLPPQNFMKVARVGNVDNPDRQRYIVMSSKLGGLQIYDGCSDFLGGTLVASLDTAQSFKGKFLDLPLKEGLPYIYAAGLVAQDIIRVDYQGLPIREINDRGPWQPGVTYYNNNTAGTDDVWHLGCRWRCFSSSTTEEPSWMSAAWTMIEGRSDARMEFDSSNGFAFFAGQVDTVITPVVLIGNANVSGDIVEEQWNWTRMSGDENADVIWNIEHAGLRILQLRNEDMGPLWSKSNPVRFTCTATYPASAINQITNYIEV
jgi:hypothetical protein